MPKQYPLPFGDEELDLAADDTALLQPTPAGAPDPGTSTSGSDQSIASNEEVPVVRAPTPLSPFREFDITLLALGKVRGIGLKALRSLYERFEDLSAIWSLTHGDLVSTLEELRVREADRIASSILTEREQLRADAQRELYRLRGENVQILARHDATFPGRLARLDDAPLWLFVEGEITALQTPLIGIVGTRTPSPVGIHAAERLAALVCREGFGIVSGLAEGIDAAAHRVGLYYRAPQVAVLGTGIDIVFPTSTEGIRRRILETGGAVITEYLPGDNYSRANFVQRNRIQAALAMAMAPIESQEQSGTAHTLRFAASYGRPLFGVIRGQPDSRNDIVGMLGQQDAPVFDLDDRAGISGLIEWLRQVVPADQWPATRRNVNSRSFFSDLLRLVDDILADIPVTPDDITWLQEQLRLKASSIAQRQEQPRRRRSRS